MDFAKSKSAPSGPRPMACDGLAVLRSGGPVLIFNCLFLSNSKSTRKAQICIGSGRAKWTTFCEEAKGRLQTQYFNSPANLITSFQVGR